MKKYFEYNLPVTAPSYFSSESAKKFEAMVKRISARMDKLEHALQISSLDGPTFAAVARKLFKNFFEAFEKQTANQLNAWVESLHDGSTAGARLDWPNAEVVVDCDFVTTKEWEMIRQLGIGGSDAAIITGTSPYRTQRELYYDKCGIAPQLPEEDKSAVFERGHTIEDNVVNAFCKITGARRIPESRMFRSKTHPASTANPDGILQFADGRIFVYEAKTTIADNRYAWVGDKIPLHYIPQTRQYPAVLADDRICGTYIGCLFTTDYTLCGEYLGSDYDEKDFISHCVERDKAAEQVLLETEAEFVRDYLEAEVIPDDSGFKPEKVVEVMRRYNGPADTTLSTVSLAPEQYMEAAKKYESLSAQLKEANDRVSTLKAQRTVVAIPFIQALGQAVEGCIPIDADTYYEVKHAPRSATKTDMEKLAVAFPDAFAACVSVVAENSRVFSLKEKKYKKGKKK